MKQCRRIEITPRVPTSRWSAGGLAEQLAARIERMIAQDSLGPDAPLVERALAARLVVSRSPVRSALRLLAARGIVERRPTGGYRVRKRPSSSPFSGRFTAQSAEEATYLKIGTDRLHGRLPERVSENDLMRRYGITRARLGAILRRIINEGWIERRPGHGWQFLPILTSGESYNQAYRFRILIEPAALLEPGYSVQAPALRRCLIEQRSLLAGAVHSVSPAQLFDANARLHESIAAGSGNVFILDALKRINRLRRLLEYRQAVDREAAARRCREHMVLIELLLSGKLSAAADFLRLHLLDAAREKADARRLALDD